MCTVRARGPCILGNRNSMERGPGVRKQLRENCRTEEVRFPQLYTNFRTFETVVKIVRFHIYIYISQSVWKMGRYSKAGPTSPGHNPLMLSNSRSPRWFSWAAMYIHILCSTTVRIWAHCSLRRCGASVQRGNWKDSLLCLHVSFPRGPANGKAKRKYWACLLLTA